jgi:hypothetical protein
VYRHYGPGGRPRGRQSPATAQGGIVGLIVRDGNRLLDAILQLPSRRSFVPRRRFGADMADLPLITGVDDADDIHARRAGRGVIACGEEFSILLIAHGVDLERAGLGRVVMLAHDLVDEIGDEQLLIDPKQPLQEEGNDNDRHRHAKHRHSRCQQRAHLVESRHPHQRERSGHHGDDTGEVREIEQ